MRCPAGNDGAWARLPVGYPSVFQMDPSRKRTIRLVVALTCALGLATALVYTSFSAGSEAKTPSQLLKDAKPGRSYQLTGACSRLPQEPRPAVAT